ncbi:MAG: flagellar biosynthetic protein FliO [Acetobacteraceae bacterium]
MILSPVRLLSAFAALLLVLGLLWLAARLARWGGFGARGPAGRRLRLVETLPLDPRRRLLLVACDGREFLLLAGPAGDLALGWLPAAGPEPAP